MTDDIVERLIWTSVHGTQEQAIKVMEEASKEIERLRQELKDLRSIMQLDPQS